MSNEKEARNTASNCCLIVASLPALFLLLMILVSYLFPGWLEREIPLFPSGFGW